MENIVNKYPNDQEFGKVLRAKLNDKTLTLMPTQDILNVLEYIKINTIIDGNVDSLINSNNEHLKSIGRVFNEMGITKF